MPRKKPDPYEKLFAEICKLYDQTIGPGVEARNRLTKTNYWKIGRRIVEEEQGGAHKGKYGSKLIPRLSEDLTARYGKGFKPRTVGYIRDFAVAYSLDDLDCPLTWSHYKVLMSVADQQRRDELEALALEQNIVVKKLERLVRQVNSLETETVGVEQLLTPRKAREGIYQVQVDEFDEHHAFLDCGFHVQVPLPVNVGSPFAHGDHVTFGSRLPAAATQLIPRPIDCAVGERYRYRGKLLNVIDGDTVLVRAELGFGIFRKVRLRLRSVAAPELALPEGKNARDFIRRRIKRGDPVTVLTYQQDLYGRYVGDVLYKNGERFLNMECIQSGGAQYVDAHS